MPNDQNGAAFDASALHPLLPKALLGDVQSVTPISMGLSGAGVYAVTAANSEYVLRVQSKGTGDSFWNQQLLILRRAAEREVAPRIVHVDEDARAVVSARVAGVPLPAALANPAHRGAAVADVVERLRALHAIDKSGIEERNAVDFGRMVWQQQRQRSAFPTWASDLGPAFDDVATVLARDTRRVVSHNDVNPGNVLWDGTRTWLVDWEVAGLGHPYYDLAAFATFLGLDAETAHGLLAQQEQTSVDDEARATFAVLRQLVALAIGNVFLSLVPDLTILPAPTRADAPTLLDCRTAMRSGALDLQTPRGQAMLGLAFLRIATEN
jgi:thiamine kinase-like enzyme